MKENLHTQAVPTKVLSEAQRKIEETITLLSPYLIALTPEDMKEMPKMGEKTVGFVDKAYDYAKQNPELVPPYLKMADFTADYADAHNLRIIHSMITQLEQGIDGIEIAAGSEAYQTALVFYHSAKTAASQNIPGANAIYEELKKRFPSTRRKKE
jgi:hypothetical protein